MDIHPTAIVSSEAILGASVCVGPYAVVEAGARLGDGVRLQSHAVVHGSASVGPGATIGVHAVVGGDPQDLKFNPWMTTGVEIGAGTAIREGATIHRSTSSTPTRVGRDCLVMGGAHIAHDCRLGDRVTVSQGAALGGHVAVEDEAVIGGAVAVHQFCRIGRLAMIGALTKVTRDVLPFTVLDGSPGVHWQVNMVGLRRRGIPAGEQMALRRVFLALQRGETDLDEGSSELVRHLLAFHTTASQRGIADFARRARLTGRKP
ncbi:MULTISPECIES: acyl-ACP--UDP-N-acetylglucosamine O-acyltransferase [unclassified Streptomyces]|uniref:acyl-ACP--UDP-N-acetylglucosamine O-acyltransferase n=1 Tax=unclassified Streptomyces TaxID=2593676 RepID=UPI002965EC56|nr:acyl-ACP--UDP-N-acetylglucosamine O-acyltransferase [Streptomyces sp. SCL15-4]